MDSRVFGIDLGTTNSAIALYENDEAKILKNIEGYETTPSVVFFTGVDMYGNDESLVGEQAKNSVATSPNNVVQFVKRFMGKQGDAYNFISPSGKKYSPEMISALILRKVCQGAEQFVGEGNVKDVVITVPAYFDDSRRIATKQAGKIAGLNVLRVINEPTAAAVAYGLNARQNGKVLVYDLGGGTFDVTVMEISNGEFNVISTGGDSQLGGVNFDQKILSMIIKQLTEQGCNIDDEDDALMAELREKSEKTKMQLTTIATSRPIFTVDGKNYRIEISRADFEKEAESLMQRTEIVVNEVLNNKNLTWGDIDQLLLVGGSTRMPMVKKTLEKISGKEISYKVDPDTAVALGAAIFASTLCRAESTSQESTPDGTPQNDTRAGKLTVTDVTSQSLGVITVDEDDYVTMRNSIIIPYNTKIPVKKSIIVSTMVDNQAKIKVEVTEGNDSDVEFVNIIGSTELAIPAHPKNSPVEIFYAYDADQTVYIEVIDKVTDECLGTFEIERKSNLSDRDVKNATAVIGCTLVD